MKQCNNQFQKTFSVQENWYKNCEVSMPRENISKETKKTNRYASMHLVAHKVGTPNIQIWNKKRDKKAFSFENM